MVFRASCHSHLPWMKASSYAMKVNVCIRVHIYFLPRLVKHWMNYEKIPSCARHLATRSMMGSLRPKRLSGPSIADRYMPGNLNVTCQCSKSDPYDVRA